MRNANTRRHTQTSSHANSASRLRTANQTRHQQFLLVCKKFLVTVVRDAPTFTTGCTANTPGSYLRQSLSECLRKSSSTRRMGVFFLSPNVGRYQRIEQLCPLAELVLCKIKQRGKRASIVRQMLSFLSQFIEEGVCTSL